MNNGCDSLLGSSNDSDYLETVEMWIFRRVTKAGWFIP